MENKQHITILGRKWFDKINGNTYHSVKVFVDQKEIGYCPFAYGYDDQYLQTVVDLMVKAGIIQQEIEPDITDKLGTIIKGNDRTYWNFLNDKRAHPEKYLIDVVDVPRKKDLSF